MAHAPWAPCGRARAQFDTGNNAVKQEQFLNVLSAEEAERVFREAIRPRPLEAQTVPLAEALGRICAETVVSTIDVPFFDRSNLDGFAVRAEDTFGAEEQAPRLLRLNEEVLHTGVAPRQTVAAGTATAIATGGVMPRGADAVLMVEHTLPVEGGIHALHAVVPGEAVSFAGTDIGAGETVLHRRTLLTSRETGVLAAIGRATVDVVRRPRVAILSTGDEIIAPGAPMTLGRIYDSNATIIADAVRELGAEPVSLGIVPDDEALLEARLREALRCDVVLLSGGTSKGAGDLNYKVVRRLGGGGPESPGILVHGVALKPGKPLCLAKLHGRPVAILPGFPTSAVFTFHAFVAPVLRLMAGQPEAAAHTVEARLPLRVNSEKGRTEFLLVNLVESDHGYAAYPMGKGSGSVTAFSKADGFIAIGRNTELLEEGSRLPVTLIGAALAPADLVVIGSQCVGLEHLLSLMSEAGWRVKSIAVGSQGGLLAAKRGECDVAGMHLLDERTGEYNRPFLDETLELLPGYGRKQGLVFRRDDPRFSAAAGAGHAQALRAALAHPDCLMINRNRGSGTRVLIDKLLAGAKPPGYLVEAKSHNAVAAAVAQGRADWGVAISQVAQGLGLGFLPIVDESYDFALPRARAQRPAVRAFAELLRDARARAGLRALGMSLPETP
ncbi:MAG: molybdopterin biosynthesis protein [Candidatus Lambdaproteobacteria bacterium]|nr:molybdopterin biosynthesis protein [Candidatus Lambdaproteobacteria bacterium]